MYECYIEGVAGDTTGGHAYICNTDEATTKQCSSSPTKYGLQISIPVDKSRNINDICVGNLWIDGYFIYVEGTENFVGDTFENYRYYNLDTGSVYLPSEASGQSVEGLPRCM